MYLHSLFKQVDTLFILRLIFTACQPVYTYFMHVHVCILSDSLVVLYFESELLLSRSIWSIDRNIMGTATPDQSGPGRNEEVFHSHLI